MRFGVSAESQRLLAEELRQRRPETAPGSEGLFTDSPDTITDLNQDDGSGTQRMSFVLGLHNPFDAKVGRSVKF